jgi:hypothetical protein
MYSYGEIGYEPEGDFDSLRDALDAAICHSVGMGVNPIGVWDSDDKLLLVLIEGDVFERQIK